MRVRIKLFVLPGVILAVLFLCVLHFIAHPTLVKENADHKVVRKTVKTASYNVSRADALSKYPPFQSSEEVEFPISESTKPRIPHVIHQIFCNETVPEPYKGFIETYIEQNPKWQYRFWSHKSGRKLLVDRYSYLIQVFDRYDMCDERKTSILKYAILHEFGGVYSDFDMENVRPLDNVTLKYACIIPVEPFENAAMRYQSQLNIFNFDILKNIVTKPYLVTDIMLCRAKHSFMKLCLTQLPYAPPNSEPQDLGGTSFITDMFMKYNNLTHNTIKKRIDNPTTNSPYFYKGERPEESNDGIYIPNSQYFYDSIDPLYLSEKTKQLSRCWNYKQTDFLSAMGKRACAEFERRKEVRRNRKYAYVIHHFHNSKYYDYTRWINEMKKIHIRKVVPGCVLYE